jgi:L-lactate dehydrogenase complex protein LldG
MPDGSPASGVETLGKEITTMNSIRNTILERLSQAEKSVYTELPTLPLLPHLAMNREELTETFVRNLQEQSAEVHRVNNPEELRNSLLTVIKENKLTRICISEDAFMENLGLELLSNDSSITFSKPSDFKDKTIYKETVFNVDAGLTSVDFAVAESGTLIIRHRRENARLLSLAPLIHLVVVRQTTLVPVYESALKQLLETSDLPSQLTFITGPSMTADIMATPFRGMHGPRRLVVFLFDDSL